MTPVPRTKTSANGAADLETLVRRVVARVVEVGGAQRSPGLGIEDDDVGVAPDLDRALAGEAEPCRRGRGEEVDHALERQAPARDALAVDEREQGLDARARRC